jgi:hypothetical protein
VKDVLLRHAKQEVSKTRTRLLFLLWAVLGVPYCGFRNYFDIERGHLNIPLRSMLLPPALALLAVDTERKRRRVAREVLQHIEDRPGIVSYAIDCTQLPADDPQAADVVAVLEKIRKTCGPQSSKG